MRSAIGAVARMLAPQLFTRLWLRAAAQKDQPGALPLGAPMLSVALIAIIQDPAAAVQGLCDSSAACGFSNVLQPCHCFAPPQELLHQSSFLVRQN